MRSLGGFQNCGKIASWTIGLGSFTMKKVVCAMAALARNARSHGPLRHEWLAGWCENRICTENCHLELHHFLNLCCSYAKIWHALITVTSPGLKLLLHHVASMVHGCNLFNVEESRAHLRHIGAYHFWTLRSKCLGRRFQVWVVMWYWKIMASERKNKYFIIFPFWSRSTWRVRWEHTSSKLFLKQSTRTVRVSQNGTL